jgi:hypothetical protein
LDGLENLLNQTFHANTVAGTTINPKINLIRYADDFIITGATKDVLENEVRPLVEQFLRERGLQLSPEKTCITHHSPNPRQNSATDILQLFGYGLVTMVAHRRNKSKCRKSKWGAGGVASGCA